MGVCLLGVPTILDDEVARNLTPTTGCEKNLTWFILSSCWKVVGSNLGCLNSCILLGNPPKTWGTSRPIGYPVMSSPQLYWGLESGSVSPRGTHHPGWWSSFGVSGVRLEIDKKKGRNWNLIGIRKEELNNFWIGIELQGFRNSTWNTEAIRGCYIFNIR